MYTKSTNECPWNTFFFSFAVRRLYIFIKSTPRHDQEFYLAWWWWWEIKLAFFPISCPYNRICCFYVSYSRAASCGMDEEKKAKTERKKKIAKRRVSFFFSFWCFRNFPHHACFVSQLYISCEIFSFICKYRKEILFRKKREKKQFLLMNDFWLQRKNFFIISLLFSLHCITKLFTI